MSARNLTPAQKTMILELYQTKGYAEAAQLAVSLGMNPHNLSGMARRRGIKRAATLMPSKKIRKPYYAKPTPSKAWLQANLTYSDGWLFRDGRRLGGINKRNGYVYAAINGKRYLGHRLVWAFHHGDIPSGVEIDHVNRNPADNTIENLRLATRAQQLSNQGVHRNCISGLKGAHYSGEHRTGSKVWHSQIIVNRKIIFLGHFDTPEEANKAYAAAADKYFGNFAGGA